MTGLTRWIESQVGQGRRKQRHLSQAETRENSPPTQGDDFASFARWTGDVLAAMLAGALTGVALALAAAVVFFAGLLISALPIPF